MTNIAIAIVGGLTVLFSFATWSRPATFGDNVASDQGQTLRGILFALWTIALPAYSLWEWYVLPRPDNLPAYAYQHKVWSDVWTAGTILLGVLFGVKK